VLPPANLPQSTLTRMSGRGFFESVSDVHIVL
jgi:hypothetical protein